MKPKAFIPGIMLNVLALLLALCGGCSGAVVLMKVTFAGLLMSAPVAVAVLVVAALLVVVGPIVGFALATQGRARAFTVVTGPVSVLALVVSFAALSAAGFNPLEKQGHTAGPRPDACKPKVTDGSAIGRRCAVAAGTEPGGDCPAELFCMERIVDHPETLECRLYCRHDCECPDGYECMYSWCAKR